MFFPMCAICSREIDVIDGCRITKCFCRDCLDTVSMTWRDAGWEIYRDERNLNDQSKDVCDVECGSEGSFEANIEGYGHDTSDFGEEDSGGVA